MSNTTPQHQVQAKVSVITDPQILAKLNALTDHISLFLVRKGQVEQKRQDMSNRTTLGKVEFWFQIDPRSNSIILCYSKHPTEWDIDAILKEINDLEHIFYVQEGVVYLDTTRFG